MTDEPNTDDDLTPEEEGDDHDHDDHDHEDHEDEDHEDEVDEAQAEEDANEEKRAAARKAVAAAAAAKAVSSRKRGRGAKKKSKGSTAGERLAAAKAAKAARKAAERGKQAEMLEDAALQQAAVATDWFEQNRQMLMMGVGAVLVLGISIFAWSTISTSNARAASGALSEATRTAIAPIVAEPEEGDDREMYPTATARAEAALPKYRAVISEHGGTQAATWARLGEAVTLGQQGDHAGAQSVFSTVLSEKTTPAIEARATEGLAFAYEAQENYSEAKSRFEDLGRIDNGAHRILADYHIARMHLVMDEEVEAKEKLRGVLDALQAEDAPDLPYVRDQAELRLMAIDSSLVQRPSAGMPGLGLGGGAGGPGGNISQEQLQELLRRAKQGQGAQ